MNHYHGMITVTTPTNQMNRLLHHSLTGHYLNIFRMIRSIKTSWTLNVTRRLSFYIRPLEPDEIDCKLHVIICQPHTAYLNVAVRILWVLFLLTVGDKYSKHYHCILQVKKWVDIKKLSE